MIIFFEERLIEKIWRHITEGSFTVEEEEALAEQLFARLMGWTDF